jgi:predicted nucleic acid-binding protein
MPSLAYPDTSFLVSLYGDDDFTPAAHATLAASESALLLCDLNRLEFENAWRLLRFRKVATPRQASGVLRAFEQDTQAGLLQSVALPWPQVLEMAHQLSERHTIKGGSRAMDILHVAAARVHPAECFYSFDERQRTLAKQAGLTLNRLS